MNEIYDAYNQQGCGEVCFPLRTTQGDGYPIMYGDRGGGLPTASTRREGV